jgi:DNA-binding transcriptional regulator YiaG
MKQGPMAGKGVMYHYTESGLDNVYLKNGFEYVAGEVVFRDIDALQAAIGRELVRLRRRLTGKEFRFLRSELLLSQATLANILGVKELTVLRWEKGHSEIPVTAEAVVRMMYLESLGKRGKKVKDLLEEIADLDDEIDRRNLTLKEAHGEWTLLEPASVAA